MSHFLIDHFMSTNQIASQNSYFIDLTVFSRAYEYQATDQAFDSGRCRRWLAQLIDWPIIAGSQTFQWQKADDGVIENR